MSSTQNVAEASKHAAVIVDRVQLAAKDKTRWPSDDADARRSFRFRMHHIRGGLRPTLRVVVDLAHAMSIPLSAVLRPPGDLALDAAEIARVRLRPDDPELALTGDEAEHRVRAAITAAREERGLGCPTIAKHAGVSRWWVHRIENRQRNGLQLDNLIAVMRVLDIELEQTVLSR